MQRVFYRMINTATLILLLLALFLSLQSSTLSPWQLGNRLIIGLFVVLLLAYVGTLLSLKRPIATIWRWVKSHHNILFWLAFCLLVGWQVALLMTLQTDVGSDAQVILGGLETPQTIAHYLSINPNNTMYFFMSFVMSKVIGTQLWAFRLATLVIIDVSVLLFRLFAKTYFNSRAIANSATLIFAYFVMAQPIFILPYTDNYGLLFTSLALLCLLKGFKTNKWGFLYLTLAGIALGLLYLLRPSAIIFVIALVVFLIISPKYLRRTQSLKKTVLLGLTGGLFFAMTVVSFNSYVAKQQIVTIDPTKGFPAVHYILLGSYGNPEDKNTVHGTFNDADYRFAIAYPNKDARKKPELQRLIARTQERGLGGSLKFYLMKYSDNVDTGIMGAHREQLWSTVRTLKQKNTASQKLQDVIYQHNIQVGDRVTWHANYQFIMQLVWLLILVAMIYTTWFYQTNAKTTLISLILLGGLLFLLIFESGGTKYMIQYTPFISLLAGYGLYHMCQRQTYMSSH